MTPTTLPNIHTPGRAERFFRFAGLWPWLGRVWLAYYAWARHDIKPTHEDALYVGHRYDQLREEFGHG